MDIDDSVSDTERTRGRASLSSSAPRAFDMAQDSQTPSSRSRRAEDNSSPSNSSGGSNQCRPARRTIVALNLSSQSSLEEDRDEGENAFASLESFLEGKFEAEQDEEPRRTKLDANNHYVPADSHAVVPNEKVNHQSTDNHKLDMTADSSSIPAANKSRLEDLSRAPDPTTADSAADPRGLREPLDNWNQCDAAFIDEEYRGSDIVLPDSPEQVPSRNTDCKRSKRPWDSTTRGPGNHGSQTLWPSLEEVPQRRNHLLDRNRRAAKHLQKQQQQGTVSSSLQTTTRSAGTAHASRTKSRIVPFQSSLVGSLPQRWVESTSTGTPHQQTQQQSSQSTTTKRRMTSSKTSQSNRTAAELNTVIQSTPAWRMASRKPVLNSQSTQRHSRQQDQNQSLENSEEPAGSKQTVYRPFGNSFLSCTRQTDQPEEDAIADVPIVSLTEDCNESPDKASHNSSMLWKPNLSGKSPLHAKLSSKQPRGPLMTAYLAAKDKWQSNRLRLHNSTTTTTTTSGPAPIGTTSSFVFRSNPMDDPRRKAVSYTDVTVLKAGKTTTSGASYLVHLVYLHQHYIADDTTIRVENQLAWACFPRRQQTRDALRIYNAVVVPWSSGGESQPQWIILATQVYEPCPRDNLVPYNALVEDLAKPQNTTVLDSVASSDA